MHISTAEQVFHDGPNNGRFLKFITPEDASIHTEGKIMPPRRCFNNDPPFTIGECGLVGANFFIKMCDQLIGILGSPLHYIHGSGK